MFPSFRNFGYKWGEGFDLLDPAGVMQQIISTWKSGGYDFVIASQFSIGHCSYNENFVNCTYQCLWNGIKWILQEKAEPPYPALRPFTETKPFLSRFHKSIPQPPSKILSTCQSCRNLRSSNTKSQESQAVRNYVLSLKNSTVAYLAYHRCIL